MITIDARTTVEQVFDEWFRELPVNQETHELRISQTDIHRLACRVDRVVHIQRRMKRLNKAVRYILRIADRQEP